jgi:ATP-binding cassette subfamily B protein
LTHMRASDHADAELRDTVAQAKGAGATRPGLLIVGALSTLFGVVLVIGSFASLVVASPLAALLIIVGAVPFLLAQRRIARLSWTLADERKSSIRRQDYLATLLFDPFSADEVRANGTGGWIVSKWRTIADAISADKENQSLKARRLIAVSALGSVVPFSAALLIGVNKAASHGDANAAGAATLILASMTAVIGELFVLSSAISQALAQKPYLAAIARVFDRWGDSLDVTSADRDVQPPATPRQPTPRPPKRFVIELDNVAFTYPGIATPTLHNINLAISKGERVALVGPSGSGKTSLLKILLGFYDVSDGTVTIRDPRTADSPRRDGTFAVLFQDFVQYSMSVRDAVIAGAGRNTPDYEIWNALEHAGAAPFIRDLEYGLETELGIGFPGSLNLSRGQWQRVALARLYVRDSPIWLLDEPTAALDPDTEEQVFNSLLADDYDRTTVFVTHRPETLRRAHRIILMEEGRIVDQGTHAELSHRCLPYQRLLAYQSEVTS